MLSLASKPKFFLLNALRGLSMISLLFVFIANIVIMAQDIQAINHGLDKDHEDCDYYDNSGVPNQPAGTFRAFFIIALNIVEVIVLFLSETGFPASIFKNWIPCLDNEHSLVGLGVLEVLLAAQMMSHFMDPFPLVACFFLLIAGLFNILTMYFDRPKFFRSYAFWKGARPAADTATLESGHSRAFTHSQYAPTSAAPSIFTEKEGHGYGFARRGDDHIVARSMSPPSVERHGASSPPNYSPPTRPMQVFTKGRGSF
jgi:hypothetical protein